MQWKDVLWENGLRRARQGWRPVAGKGSMTAMMTVIRNSRRNNRIRHARLLAAQLAPEYHSHRREILSVDECLEWLEAERTE